MPSRTIPIKDLMPALKNVKNGWVREAFDGEEPDFVQTHDKLCTALTYIGKGRSLTVEFPVPVQLEAGRGYVIEESPEP